MGSNSRRFLAGIGLVTALFVGTSQFASADPYFVVDDPGTPEAHHYEVDLVTATSQTISGEQQNPLIDATYGYNDNFAIAVTTGALTVRNSGMKRITGCGDSSFEEVWRFAEETKNAPQLAIHNATKIPTAPSDNGLGSGKFDDSLDITFGKSFGKAALYGDAGYTWLGGQGVTNNTFYGLKLNYQATDKIVAGFEVFGNTSPAPGTNPEFAYNIGLSYDLTPDRSLLLTIGRSTEGYSDLSVMVGLQLELGPQTPDEPSATVSVPAAAPVKS
jgi:hypothetical protein